jgi:serine/threonine protein kinase
MEETLGRGAYAVVTVSGDCAVKRFETNNETDKKSITIVGAVEILLAILCEDDSTVPIIEWCLRPNTNKNPWYTMPIAMGDLWTFGGIKHARYSIEEVMHQVCEGLYQLHKWNVQHNDVKMTNVLIYEDRLRLADFGNAIYLPDGNPTESKIVPVEKSFAAPELRNGIMTPTLDIWSLGILGICCVRDIEFITKDLTRDKFNTEVKPYIKQLPEKYHACLSIDWRERPTSAQLLNLEPINRNIPSPTESARNFLVQMSMSEKYDLDSCYHECEQTIIDIIHAAS